MIPQLLKHFVMTGVAVDSVRDGCVFPDARMLLIVGLSISTSDAHIIRQSPRLRADPPRHMRHQAGSSAVEAGFGAALQPVSIPARKLDRGRKNLAWEMWLLMISLEPWRR